MTNALIRARIPYLPFHVDLVARDRPAPRGPGGLRRD
jgi:hypothetical protein